MRVVQFVQVVVLLLMVGYAVLVYLENPVLLRLPLLVAGREAVLPAGLGLALALLVGALYTALLILPRYLRQRLLRLNDLARRRDAETRLQATLQAVVNQASVSEQTAPEHSSTELSAVLDAPLPDLTAPQRSAVDVSA
ncbi:hypothetical protein [Deinococcus ruber]|uniref:Lipopolysaccharide assembly protein A domain-containing protein n=1 Tax=Deinococcus ruber TaxID=1848197 RepID=A0A918KX91_9DEIO|nr:hypothetical protein [Deinococcus ruber]GGR39013.1 hypothetical protein GCM10008957_54950 [Deinococcus ruber]